VWGLKLVVYEALKDYSAKACGAMASGASETTGNGSSLRPHRLVV
jgi:hypothetical protein